MKSLKLNIVIHAEEEFDWDGGFYRNNDNVSHGDALIDVIESMIDLGGRVTLAMDYPFVRSAEGQRVIHHFKPLEGKSIEFATHLHPWVNPPFDDDLQTNDKDSFPGNLPKAVEFSKLEALTSEIEYVTGTQPTTYLAGRYGIGKNTETILKQLGYTVDLSISGYSDFSRSFGPDFSLKDNRLFSDGKLTSIPHTCSYLAIAKPIEDYFNRDPSQHSKLNESPIGRIMGRLMRLSKQRLSPEGFTFKHMKRVTEAQYRVGQEVFVLSFHSPSVKVGLTPYVKNLQELEAFKQNLFSYIRWFAALPQSQFVLPSEQVIESTRQDSHLTASIYSESHLSTSTMKRTNP